MPEFDSTIQYRDVVGIPGYRVGSDGTVWTCWTRTGFSGDKREQLRSIQGPNWKQLRDVDKGDGRMILHLRGRGMCRVHRLVLEAFVGPCPEGMECCHNDGNPRNNHLSNLRWDTPKNNNADKKQHGTANYGERNPQAKLTEAGVLEMRKDYAEARKAAFLAGKQKLPNGVLARLAAKHGVTTLALARIARGERWSYLG